MKNQSDTFGWSFPIGIDERTGRIKTTDFKTDIKQSILILLSTIKGERLMHKSYGTGIKKFMFEPISYNLIKNINDEVSKSIRIWEKRVQSVTTDIYHSKENDTLIIIHIKYTIKTTGEEDEFDYMYNLLET